MGSNGRVAAGRRTSCYDALPTAKLHGDKGGEHPAFFQYLVMLRDKDIPLIALGGALGKLGSDAMYQFEQVTIRGIAPTSAVPRIRTPHKPLISARQIGCRLGQFGEECIGLTG